MAKGIGNGFPMAAVVTTPQIAQCLTQAIHFNTFGGNPMASAVGSAVLDVSIQSQIGMYSAIILFLVVFKTLHSQL